MTNLVKTLEATYKSEEQFASERIGDFWDTVDWCGVFDATKPQLEINPEPRPWVGLTEKEVIKLQEFAYDNDLQFVRHIEQLLKEKNNG